MRCVDRVVTRTMLLEAVWDFHFDPKTNIVEFTSAGCARSWRSMAAPSSSELCVVPGSCSCSTPDPR